MKRILKVLMIILFSGILMLISSLDTFAAFEDDEYIYDDEISSQVDSMLEDYDISFSYEDMDELSLSGIISAIGDAISSRIHAPVKLLGIILVIILFTSFVKSAGESVFPKNSSLNLYNLVCVLAAVIVISPTLLEAYENAANSLERGGGFMLIFVPVFAGISIVSGGITSAGIYNAVTLGAAEIMVQISSNIIMPVLTMTAALAICGSIFDNTTLDSIVQLIRKIITWGMTVAVTLFTGFISLKCTIGSAADGFTAKTVKFMVSGFVPIVGNAISDAYTTVKGSFDIMRCTAGTAGTIAIVMIMLPPVLELLAFRAVMWAANAAAGMFEVKPLEKLFKSLDAGLAIALSVIVCFSVLFIISTAILMKSLT